MSSPSHSGKAETFSSVLAKAFSAKSSWPEKETFLDVLYWLRQVLGLLTGLVFGLLAFKGAAALAAFAIISSVAGYLYCVAFQGIDEEVRELVYR